MVRRTRQLALVSVAVVIAIWLISGGTTHAGVLNGLVGHWNFDGDYLDTSISENYAVPSGSLTLVAGRLGQALSVTGSSYVRTQYDSVVSGNQARTVNVWFNASLQTEAPLSGGSAGNGQVFDLYLRNDGIFGGHFYGSGYQTMAVPPNGSDPTYSANDWTMATLVYDGGTKVDVYNNGDFVKSTNMSGQLNTGATSLYMGGGGGWTTTDDYAGLVDDVSLWNRPLTASEIKSVFDAAAEGYSLSAPRALQFDFSDNNGSAFGNLGPGQSNGPITGGVWNTIQGHFSGTAKDELGNDVPDITVEFGGTSGDTGSEEITNWGTASVGEVVNTTSGGGVHATALMTDTIYVSSGSRNVMGARIKGLAAGDYQVYFMPRHYLVTSAFDIDIGMNIDGLTGNSFTSPALSAGLTEWVEGTDLQAGNYFSQVVRVSGVDDWVVMLSDQAGTSVSDFMGFQIVQIPEPSGLILLGLGTLMFAGRRRRRRTVG